MNTMREMGDKMVDKIIFQKILRYLLMRFDSKISTLEERQDLATLSMDEIYEMRTG